MRKNLSPSNYSTISALGKSKQPDTCCRTTYLIPMIFWSMQLDIIRIRSILNPSNLSIKTFQRLLPFAPLLDNVPKKIYTNIEPLLFYGDLNLGKSSVKKHQRFEWHSNSCLISGDTPHIQPAKALMLGWDAQCADPQYRCRQVEKQCTSRSHNSTVRHFLFRVSDRTSAEVHHFNRFSSFFLKDHCGDHPQFPDHWKWNGGVRGAGWVGRERLQGQIGWVEFEPHLQRSTDVHEKLCSLWSSWSIVGDGLLWNVLNKGPYPPPPSSEDLRTALDEKCLLLFSLICQV